MSRVTIVIQILLCLNLLLTIISQESNKYCQLNSECELESHIGCAHSTLRSSGYGIEHLKYSDRLSVINQLNQFRSDIAVGNSKFRSESFSDMKKILWNYELEKLLKLSIQKISNTQFPCVLTSKSDRISQFIFGLDKPKSDFTIEATLSELLSNVIKRAVENHKTAAPNDILAYSYLFNPETSTVGCAVGSRIDLGGSSSIKKILVRCAFNGTKIDKNFLEKHNGWQCSDCSRNHMKCDEFFPGLCAPANIKGVKGNKGPIGASGRNGPDGDRGNFGDIGENGMNGSNGAKGEKGDVGKKGDAGRNAISGSKGDKGDRGQKVHGTSGKNGDRGKNGVDGATGRKGEPGPRGPKGNYNHSKGEKGDKATNISGDVGYKGVKGIIGDTGLKGVAGPKGESGYVEEIHLMSGASLLEYCKLCPKGNKGATGPPGIPGLKGNEIRINKIY